MLPDGVSNPGPLTYESGALPIALRGPASLNGSPFIIKKISTSDEARIRDPWISRAALNLLSYWGSGIQRDLREGQTV